MAWTTWRLSSSTPVAIRVMAEVALAARSASRRTSSAMWPSPGSGSRRRASSIPALIASTSVCREMSRIIRAICWISSVCSPKR